MSASCPHCAKELGSGFVTQDQLVAEKKGVSAARDAANEAAAKAIADLESVKSSTAAQLKVANEQVSAASAASSKALADMARATAERDRFSALANDGIVKPAKVRGISAAYDAYAAENKDHKPFAEWLATDARADEFLAPHFAAPIVATVAEVAKPADVAAPVVPAVVVAPAGKPLPAANVNVGTAPLATGKLSAEQAARTYSDGVDAIRAKGLSRDDRNKEIAALKATVSAQVGT